MNCGHSCRYGYIFCIKYIVSSVHPSLYTDDAGCHFWRPGGMLNFIFVLRRMCFAWYHTLCGVYLVQGCTNPERHVAVATKFCTLACNSFGLLCGICFLSPFCRLSGFWVSFWYAMSGSCAFRHRPVTANGHDLLSPEPSIHFSYSSVLAQ